MGRHRKHLSHKWVPLRRTRWRSQKGVATRRVWGRVSLTKHAYFVRPGLDERVSPQGRHWEYDVCSADVLWVVLECQRSVPMIARGDRLLGRA